MTDLPNNVTACEEYLGHTIGYLDGFYRILRGAVMTGGFYLTRASARRAIDDLERIRAEDAERRAKERISHPNRTTNLSIPQLAVIRNRLNDITGCQIELMIDGLKGIVDYGINSEDAGEEDKRRALHAQELLNFLAN